MKIERYLGFTNSFNEPRKTKVENLLNKPMSFEIINSTSAEIGSEIIRGRAIECFATLITKGFTPDKKENVQYYKRNGELTKAKNEYRLVSPYNSTFFEIKKTEYDFCCYLIEQQLTTETAILEYDAAEVAKIEAAERELSEALEKERIKMEQEQKERENALNSAFKYELTEEEEEVMNILTVQMYSVDPWKSLYDFVGLIHNIDNKYCKECICEILALNDNKLSIKIFNGITGLTLPAGQKERLEYIHGITSADFKGIDKTNDNSTSKNKKKAYYICMVIADKRHSTHWKKRYGVPYNKYGIEMFIFRDGSSWNISHVQSGISIVCGKTKSEAVNTLDAFVNRMGESQFIKKLEEMAKKVENICGLNPLFQTAV